MILAGGHARRMGNDKCRVPFAGQPMVEHVRRALARVAADCWLSLRDGQVPPIDGLQVVRDAGLGPLGGIAAGLERLPPDGVLVAVACDMPRVSPSLLTELVDAIGDHDAAVPVLDGIPQVTCAAWAALLAGTAAELVAEGVGAPRELLSRARAAFVPGDRWREALRSFDRPEDVAGDLS